MINHPHQKRSVSSLFLSTAVSLFLLCGAAAQGQTGTTWTLQTTPVANGMYAVTYGKGLFVGVSVTGTGNRVMTSPDGVTWTARVSAADNSWDGIAYGNGIFVAVAQSGGAGNRVMTSPDGISWTIRASPAVNSWIGLTYGNGLFVAVSITGTGNRVITSPDGITWTSRVSAADNNWRSVAYGNGVFVAVAYTGTTNRVMTSTDGITWVIRTAATNNNWYGVTYGNGLFVAVAITGTGNRVMTSPDGTTWTTRTTPADNNWLSVFYGGGLYVAVASSGTGNRVMTSPDAITWTIGASAANNIWTGITYANGIFVAVSNSAVSNSVMTSGTFTVLPVSLLNFSGKNSNGINQLLWQTAAENNTLRFDIENSSNGVAFKKIGTTVAAGNSSTIKTYHFTDGKPFEGITYYRLKQTDIDGKFIYSTIISIKKVADNSVFIYPNPAGNTLNISVPANYIGSNAQLYSLDGRLLKTIPIIKDVQQIDVAALSSNTYLLKLKDGTMLKWVKE